MALITLVIFTEKSSTIGPRVAQIAALVLIGYGALVLLLPDALPTMT
jgi:hypothetical protein